MQLLQQNTCANPTRASPPATVACSAARAPCVSASCSLKPSTGSSAAFATAAATAASLAAACAAARPLCSSSSCCWLCCWCCSRLLLSALLADRLVTAVRSCGRGGKRDRGNTRHRGRKYEQMSTWHATANVQAPDSPHACTATSSNLLSPCKTHLLLLAHQLRNAGLRAVCHGGGQLLKHISHLRSMT